VRTTFFKGFFLNPRTTGAIFPSSPYLARSMANCISKNKSGYVLELGPGTGVITKAILQSGILDNQLISVELAPHFTQELKKQFPAITVIEGDATRLSELVKDKQPIHTIISSLPLRSISKENRELIFTEIQKVLIPGGQFIQFTYSMKKAVDYYPHNFKLTKSFIVWRNIPPARVTVFEI
jgi:phosphatidylethanolamine/phosphatidyl-N-methylethanolamine N-methyltransferase